MSRLRPVAVVVVVVAALLACVLLLPSGDGSIRPGSTHSTGASGAAALELWLQELGFETERLEYREFILTPDDRALFVITPAQDFRLNEVDEALRWVRDDGGTLIVADTEPLFVLDELGISLDDSIAVSGEAQARQPLAHPPVNALTVDRAARIQVDREDGVVLLEDEDGPLLMAFNEGRGIIYVTSYPSIMTNYGLRDQQAAAVVLNLLSRVPSGGRVLFDEIHHGFKLADQPQPRRDAPSPLSGNPFWQGLIYAALIIALYILLTGRRFGRPVPLREDVGLRSSAEYVQSMAGLLERGRKTGYVLHHYKEQFKRRLAKHYGFNPRVPDAEFIRELSRFQQVDQARLSALLQRLSHEAPDPATLLRLVHEADGLAREIERARTA